MSRIVRIALLILIAVSLMSCVDTQTMCTAGAPFVRHSTELRQLGKTTKHEVVTAMGDPTNIQEWEANGHRIESITYAHIWVGGSDALGGRAAYFRFHNGILVGYSFVSQYDDTSSDFDLAKIRYIIDNTSTRQDIENILGTPSGERIYPMIDEHRWRLLSYQYYLTSTRYKWAEFMIDENGVLRHSRAGINQ